MNPLVLAMFVMVLVFIVLTIWFPSWPCVIAACLCMVAAALLWGLS